MHEKRVLSFELEFSQNTSFWHEKNGKSIIEEYI